MSFKGKKMSDKTREALKKANFGKKYFLNHKHSEETKQKIRLALLGKPRPKEVIEKMRKANLGKKHSKESIQKMRLIKLGKKKSLETRLRMSIAKKNISNETRLKMSNAQKGRIISEESRKRMSVAKKGKQTKTGWKHTIEAKKLISEKSKGNKRRLGKKLLFESKKKIGSYHKGKLSSFWRGGTTPLTILRLHNLEWKEISRQVRNRDNNICQHCGLIGENQKLDVHHKIPYYLTQNNSLDNLITLCASCHSKEERRFENEIRFLRALSSVVFNE